MKRLLIAGIAAALLFLVAGCREEGPAEKAGRQIDEAVDEIAHGSEGTMEKMGREMDEAADDMKDAVEDATD